MFKKIKDKVKDSVEKIKQDFKEMDLSAKQRLILKYLNERGGIANLQMMGDDLGILVSVIKHEIGELLNVNYVEGSFIFDDTEFILHDSVKEHIRDRIQDFFKFDLNQISNDFGVPISLIRDVLTNFIASGEVQGFFDVPANKTFFNISSEEEENFINMIREKPQKIKDLAVVVEDIILSHEELDIDGLIEKIEEKPKQEDEDDLFAMAEEMVKVNVNEQRARIWIETLLHAKKISGNFDKKLELFTSDAVFLDELFTEIKAAGRIGLYDIESRYGVTSKDKIKTYLMLLGRNKGLKGYYSEDEEEFITEEKIIQETEQLLGDQDEISISSINLILGLKDEDMVNIVSKLIKDGKLEGILSKDKEKFYQIKKLNAGIMEILSENKEVLIEELSESFNISETDTVSLVKKLNKRYNKQLRGFITTDNALFIKEEPLNFKIIELIRNSESKKIPLLEFQESLKLSEEDLVFLLDKMLEFGVISGKISKDSYVK